MFTRLLLCAIALVLLAGSGCTAYVDEPIISEDDDMAARKPGNFGWSQSGRLITFNQNAGVTLQQKFPIPGPYTVQFDIMPSLPNQAIKPTAEVTWSVMGNQIARLLDAGDGTSLTGVAEAVRVRLVDGLVPGLTGTPGQEYVGTISVTRGAKAPAANQAPTFKPVQAENPIGTPVVYDGQLTVLAASSARVQRPAGATQVLVSAMPLGAGAVTPDLLFATAGNAAGPVVLMRWFPFPPAIPTWVALPSQSTQVAIFNNTGVDVVVAFLFGIDG